MKKSVKPLLKRVEIRRSSRKARPTESPLIEIKNQDAFEFLTSLKPSSVDLFVSSPPYCIGKSYEKSMDTADFIRMHERLAPLLVKALKDGGK